MKSLQLPSALEEMAKTLQQVAAPLAAAHTITLPLLTIMDSVEKLALPITLPPMHALVGSSVADLQTESWRLFTDRSAATLQALKAVNAIEANADEATIAHFLSELQNWFTQLIEKHGKTAGALVGILP